MYLLPEELMDSADREVWPDLLAMLGNSRNSVAKVLMGKGGIATTLSDSEALNKEIIAQKKTQKAAYPYLKCLVKWVEWVNCTHNLEICISNVPVYTKPPLSPFTDEVREYPADYRQYMDFLLNACAKELSPEAELGRAICSATLLGGLHHKYLVRALMRVLSEPMSCLSGHVWYNLEVVNRDDEALERRIWEPDPLSEIFLLNLSNEAIEYLADSTLKCIPVKRPAPPCDFASKPPVF